MNPRTGPMFLLGSANASWLGRAGVPLFVSDTRLREYKSFRWRAVAPWAADSGGFSQLQKHGRWTITPGEYVDRLRRYRDEIGSMLWAAPQDSMCEDAIIDGGWYGGQYFVGTRRFVDPHGVMTTAQIAAEHMRATVLNFLELRELAPDLWIIPVIQGREPDDYVSCTELYWDLGRIDLTTAPLVGVGSVCRRQAMGVAGDILTALHRRGVTRLHGFGFKLQGLAQHGHLLSSADSLAWSEDARRKQHPVCATGHPRGAKNCANCLPYALQWRDRALAAAATGTETAA
jgi:hypothetical protein